MAARIAGTVHGRHRRDTAAGPRSAIEFVRLLASRVAAVPSRFWRRGRQQEAVLTDVAALLCRKMGPKKRESGAGAPEDDAAKKQRVDGGACTGPRAARASTAPLLPPPASPTDDLAADSDHTDRLHQGLLRGGRSQADTANQHGRTALVVGSRRVAGPGARAQRRVSACRHRGQVFAHARACALAHTFRHACICLCKHVHEHIPAGLVGLWGPMRRARFA